MTPADFPQANRTLTAPAGRPDVLPLRTYTDGEVCISRWRLS